MVPSSKIKHLMFNYLIVSIILLTSSALRAQDTISSTDKCSTKTIFELFKKKDSLTVIKPTKNSFFLVIPVIGSQPATGFVLAV